jgi:hypothetical protein
LHERLQLLEIVCLPTPSLFVLAVCVGIAVCARRSPFLPSSPGLPLSSIRELVDEVELVLGRRSARLERLFRLRGPGVGICVALMAEKVERFGRGRVRK